MNWRVFSVMLVINAAIVVVAFVHAYHEPFYTPAVGPSFGKAASIMLSTGLKVGFFLPLMNGMLGFFVLAAGLRQPEDAAVDRARILAIAVPLFIVAGLALAMTVVACKIIFVISPS